MGFRGCPFCGKKVPDNSYDCPFCHETLPQMRAIRSRSSDSGRRGLIRRGLLYMLVVAAVYYFVSSSSPVKLPMKTPALLTTYLLPLFFLCGLGFFLYGVFRRVSG